MQPGRVPIYHASGDKVFLRHSLNNRRNAAVRRKYRDMIYERGIVKDARAGKMYVVPDCLDNQRWHLHMLSAATLMEALYEAHEAQPGNIQ
eukprot:4929101-Alexandrium_andersonii.AAC.1